MTPYAGAAAPAASAPDAPSRGSSRIARSTVRGILPLALVGLTLLGSVVIPARQTWLITGLLHETTEVLAPSRLLVEQLQAGLAGELVALQNYALSADRGLLAEYRTTASADDGRLAALDSLAVHRDAASQRQVQALRTRVAAWHRLNDSLVAQDGAPARFAAALRAGQSLYDSSLTATVVLSSGLAATSAARDDRVRALERWSILANAILVLAALVAITGVLILTLRERRLAAVIGRRVAEESALRQLARRLSTTMTRGEALRCVAEGALTITPARGASVEWATSRRHVLECVALPGERTRTSCARAPRSGSLTEGAVGRDSSHAPTEIDATATRLADALIDEGGGLAALVAPLLSSHDMLGVVVLYRSPPAPAFDEDDRRQLQLVSDLASATLRRVDGMVAERRALREARRRARREAALREAAESLAGAYTIDEVTQRITDAALHVMSARGAFVERIAAVAGESGDVAVVRAVSGDSVPPLEQACPLAGSYAELVSASGRPMLIPDPEHAERSGIVSTLHDGDGSVIAVPLRDDRTPMGALFVVGSPAGHFRSDDVLRAGIFGHLASLAYEKVRLLEEAHDRRRVLERVIQSRSRLMRGFSHDVKNPIGAADGFAELLSMGMYGELSAPQQASIDRMRRNIRSALALIDDLHELSRAETGNIVLAPESVSLVDLVRGIGEEYHAAAVGRGLSLTVDVDLDIPPLLTDPARLRQVASNLLSNAIKYTDSGSVVVRARRQPDGPGGAGGDWVVIEFTDSGAGIPAERQDYIFEEFSRLGTGTSTGAGLGLAISRLVVQALGGQISVRSELGRGSTFTIWLPLQRPDPVG